MFNLKKIAGIIILISLFVHSGIGQISEHPYSFYAIGIPDDQILVRNAGMGGLSVADFNNTSISFLNPASYSGLELTNFQIAFKGKFFKLDQDTTSVYSNIFSFAYFNLGFPVYKKMNWNVAFGMLPVSKIGYSSYFKSVGKADTIDRTEKFEYTGGFSKFFIGTSLKLFKGFYLGANLFYLFGNTHVYHSLLITESSEFYGAISDKNSFYGNIGFNAGFNYKIKLNDKKTLNIGAYYEPSTKLKINEEEIVTSFLNTTSSIKLKDTIFKTSTIGGNFQVPLKYGAGILLKSSNKWQAGFDYKFEEWSTFNFPGIPQLPADQHEFVLGFETTPNVEDLSYFKRISYRTGLKYTLSYLNVPVKLSVSPLEYENLKNFSLSIGAGFPVRKSASFIDAAVEIGQLGSLHDDVIREQYIRLSFGFRFNDIWFIKPKYE